jgi:8-oxo-dGTP pyrophosphatase MutT (NUDIX family)
MTGDRGPVRAAGGVVTRTQSGVEIALVHRPRYDDWSFPKGKRDPGETDEQCAVREVEEETGLRCSLGRELLPTRYIDRKGRPKVVRYWEMRVVGERAFAPNDEVDELVWLPVDQAARRLTYGHDADVLANVRLAFTSGSPGPTRGVH